MSQSEYNHCFKPQDLAEIQEIVRDSAKLVFLGAGTKKALSGIPDGFTCLDLTGWTGVTEYQPDEFTITVRAGTPVAAVAEVLKANRQYLPFDPLLVNTGATVGGTVASGLNGSGRYRFGGVRDFLLGVKFINWKGELASGGGSVVKNAAGFDLPKLMVGSLGMYGCLLELTFKVFPAPRSTITVGASFPTYDQAATAQVQLTLSPLEIIKLDIEPGLRTYTLWIQLGAAWEEMGRQRIRLSETLREAAIQELTEASEEDFWHITREFLWTFPSANLVKVPLTPKKSAPLEMELAGYGHPRRYSCAGNVLWLGWDTDLERLDSVLTNHNLAGLLIWGPAQRTVLGTWESGEFAQRIKRALDPSDKFSNLANWPRS